jgi:hypothetical protein
MTGRARRHILCDKNSEPPLQTVAAFCQTKVGYFGGIAVGMIVALTCSLCCYKKNA